MFILTFLLLFIGSGHSGRLDNGNQNELVPDVWIMEIKTNRNARRNYDPDLVKRSTTSPPGRDFKVPGYHFNISKVKGTEKTKGKGEDERGKGRERERENRNGAGEHFEGLMAPWTYRSSIFQRFGGSCP
ncbi:unnamed protein product [Rhizophagus irregularis]|nr:unnamed protein product [Rhizophagus irregularis]